MAVQAKPYSWHMIVLQSICPEENRFREYIMELEVDLFSANLNISWGRIGGRHRRIELQFDTRVEAEKEARRRLKRRGQRRYVVIECTDNTCPLENGHEEQLVRESLT